MFRRVLGVFVLGSSIVWSGAAAAQERVPHTGTNAVGVDVGAFVPADDVLDNALLVSVLLEHYLTPRVSLRTDFGLTDPSFSTNQADSLRQIPLRVDVNYNWERGKWHPFVGAGAGAYFLRFKDDGQAIGDTEVKPGINFGGGMEYFTGRTVSLKGEVRYHRISRTTRGGQQDPSGLVVTGGLKKYF